MTLRHNPAFCSNDVQADHLTFRDTAPHLTLIHDVPQSENARKERLTKVAMSARAEAITAYRDLKSQGADLERRLRETQVPFSRLR